jgi:hypothetical protein
MPFRNPLTFIWGFHCHNDVPNGNDFANALLIQRACIEFLLNLKAPLARFESYWPGYGPHRECMWEIRVEDEVHGEIKEKIAESRTSSSVDENNNTIKSAGDIRLRPLDAALEKELTSENGKYNFVDRAKKLLPMIGAASLWMMKNNRGQGGYIHIIFHDETLDFKPQIAEEAVEHQNILYFSKHTPIDIDFFLNPPLDENGNLKDTRTHAIMDKKDREDLIKTASHGHRSVFQSELVSNDNTTSSSSLSNSSSSALFIERGFRVFVGFSGRSQTQAGHAFALFEALNAFLDENGQSADEKWIERDANRANAGFCLTFLKSEKKSTANVCSNIGYALTYLMMNRGPLDVSLIPVADCFGEQTENMLKKVKTLVGQNFAFVGQPPSLMGREIIFGSI